ncbi:hypothetical protein R1sor_008813 [Riccia sorocarpa]|uniref:RING-type domain-containing protein n=1 Tax=Riccia sorocarpa TaxID=122646 RepID=A0ABD3HUH9_9MARC
MATSNMRVSTVDYNCMLRKYSSKTNVPNPHLDQNPSCGMISGRDVKHPQSRQQDPKSECFNSKDASKRKRVNRTAKLKQCKLDARREQWLSQGNYSRGKPEDRDCSHEVGLKGTIEESPGSYIEQGISLKSSGPVCSENQELMFAESEQIGAESSSGKHLTEGSNPGKQSISVRWGGCRDPELSELSRVKNQFKGKDLRLEGDTHADIDLVEVQGKSLMHKCTLSDRKNIPSHLHLNGSAMVTYAKSSDIRRKGSGMPPDERGVRMSTASRTDEDTTDAKYDRGASCRAVSEGDYSPTQSTSSCVSSYSGSSSGENGSNHSHDAEDDWETVADAIYMQGSACKPGDVHKAPYVEKETSTEKKGLCSGTTELQKGALKPEYKYKGGMLGGRMRGVGGRAWRPDDAARPPTLPRLSKQHSFPLQSAQANWNDLHGSNLWGPPPAPLFCPICTEELDVTDSSFVPCSCGFRLCLFCHHRIAADDGRCPGCRKPYNSDVAMKLSRSSSVWLRV